MFTGLIQDIGTILSINKHGDWRITIGTNFDMKSVPIGASICCGGCCLTVIEKTNESFTVEVSSESLEKTNLKNWKEGTHINLEPSLKMGDELGGHFVFGHVDDMAKLVNVEMEGDSYRLKVKPNQNLMRYIAPKGSVTLDGVSLTVNEVDKETFGVNIIPHTWDHTTFSYRKVGDDLNIEIDMLARYVARMLSCKD